MTSAPLACPRCRQDAPVGSASPPLFAHQTPGVLLHGCARCSGVFLSQACATHLSTHLPRLTIELAARASAHATHQPDLRGALACPRCGRAMRRQAVAAARIELDVCEAGCGTWYDKDEITRVTDAIRASGWARGPAGGPSAGVVAAGAVGVAAVGAAAVGAVALAGHDDPGRQDRAELVAETVEAVGDGAVEVAADVAIETVAEGGFEVAGGVLEVLGGLFDW